MNTDKNILVTTPEELAEAVQSAPRVLAVGAGTKPRLSAVASEVVKISTVKLSGIVEYEPSEFTFTALAGTPVKEIAAALAERGQYLPFDPLLVDAGATIGGTVAAGCVILFNLRTLHTHIQDMYPELLNLEMLSIYELKTLYKTFRSLCKIILPFTPYALSLCGYIGIRDNLAPNQLVVLKNAAGVLVPMDANLGNPGFLGQIPLIVRIRALINDPAFIASQRTLEVMYLASCVTAAYPDTQAMAAIVLSNHSVQDALITLCKQAVANVFNCVLWRFNLTPQRRNVRRNNPANVGGIRRRKNTLYSKRKNRQPKRRVTRKINNRPKTKKYRKKFKK